MRSTAVCVFLCVCLAAAKNEEYDGSSLFEVSVNSVEKGEFLAELADHFGVDVWRYASPGHPGKILVSKERISLFESELKYFEIESKIVIENIKESIDKEQALLAQARSKSYNTSQIGLPIDRIYTYEEVDAYLDTLASAYPQIVTLVNAGKSFEGRDIRYLKISTTNFQDTSKPIVFLESLLHSREWITLPVTLYAIEKLVIDVTEQDLLQDIDWVILPIVNPDGYVFSHTDNRFWRKNRATGYIINDICRGVDLNRNFEYNWSRSFSSSFIPCSLNFHGRGPLSEPEAVIVDNILKEYSQNARLQLFIDVHSYGSQVFYGYGNRTLPSNGLWLHLVGVNMVQAIDSVKLPQNPNYIVGNIGAIIPVTISGLAQDQALLNGVPFSYTYELPAYRPGVEDDEGFLVDPDFIGQGAFETWEGIKVGARYVRDNYRYRNLSKLDLSLNFKQINKISGPGNYFKVVINY